ncbi:MAG: glucosaminidase domain-containing protein [Roseiflexaceae bacterium]
MEFLDSLLRQSKSTPPGRRTSTTRPSPTLVRNTDAIATSGNTGAIATKRNTSTIATSGHTDAIVTKRNTGSIATKRATDTITTTRNTGSIATKRATDTITTTRNTGPIATKRNTGPIITKRNTGPITTKRNTGKVIRYSVEEEDLYGGFANHSSVIYTAGTNLFWVILIAIIVWLVVSMAQSSPSQSVVSNYSQSTGLRAVAQIIGIQLPESIAPEPESKPIIIPPGESSILGAPTMTAAQIDAVLSANNSPAAGTGAIWVEAGLQYGIDPAYGLAFFMHESSYGTNPAWAGIKPDGTSTHNVGNIICAGYRTCFGRFRDYPDWRTGIYDWYRLIAVEYVQWRGLATVEGILPVYAPAFENDVPRYVNVIKYAVAEWRQSNMQPTP